MDGIIYFGRQSIDVNSWTSTEFIDHTVEEIKNLFNSIHNCNYAEIKVPYDWTEEVITAQTLWEKLYEIFQGQMDLLTHVYDILFNKVLNNCFDKKISINEIADRLNNTNPNIDKSEYYGVAKTSDYWDNIPPNLHVSNIDDLNDWALNFLSNAPINEENYSLRCDKIFTNLIFHDEFSSSLVTHGTETSERNSITGIHNFSIPVTKLLSALNSIDVLNKNPKEIISEIIHLTGYHCSPQGKHKSHLHYEFTLEDNSKVSVLCEFHIKFNTSNKHDKIKHYQRIYFGINTVNSTRKIFIAHSGKHL